MRQRLTAPAVMIASGLSLYAGAALAVGLFERFPPTIVAWFRVAAAGVVLLVVVRPARWEFTRRVGLVAGVFGCVTMGMNMVFYEAIAELPLGTAVAIEFMGPIVVAAWGSRSIRDWLALLLAGGGVLLMSGARWSASPRGVIFALLAATLWAIYIVLGARIATAGSSNGRLAVGFCYAAVVGLPLVAVLWPHGAGVPLPTVVGLGILSAAIPYSLDQVVLRMAGPSYFAILLALLPLTAALLGAVALGQSLSIAEMAGIVAVVGAVVVRDHR